MEQKQSFRPFQRVLIANRGEIAIRVARAASEIGITTVGIYTHEDRFSQHRYKTDEAYQIGSSDEPLKPYLDIDAVVAVAKREKVDAIHPGYGFLSENVAFARKCKEANLIFIGPEPEEMEALGDKIQGKILAKKNQVPVIEGFQLAEEVDEKVIAQAEKIGFPVIIKASGGGGGRGMRVAWNKEELKQLALEARSEAMKAFGNGTIFIEKYIHNPKHIEVQLLGDKHGNLVHLFERDCSVQRRFQKVVEVAPCISIRQETKEKLYAYAVRLGKSIRYSGAGTVEFLVDEQENIYFIEVNTRIQVEHTVTEEITNLDLVRSQFFIAMGCRLYDAPLNIPLQHDITAHGIAIQCRITTEDPSDQFKPNYGIITAYRNASGYGIRLDESGVYSGYRISPFFDSLLAKVTAKGRFQKAACLRMIRALQEFRIRGVQTNIGFLVNVLKNSDFQEGLARVGFIQDHPELLKTAQSQDSATKTLFYIGNIIVNGQPDVKNPDLQRKFNLARVPEFDVDQAYPKGSRDLFLELGREKFCKNLLHQKKIEYTDTTFRDAHQSLFATRLRSDDMLKIAEGYAKNFPQVFSMEVWGGATFDVCLRFLKEDPWHRLQLLRKKIPNILFQMLFRGSNGVGYSAYPDNLIESFIIHSAEQGIDIFRIFDSLNWLPSMKNSIETVIKKTDKIVEAAFCYTGDILDKNRAKYNLQYYIDLARKLEDMGSHILGIKDMAGILTPYAAELLINTLKEKVSLPIHLHTHDTSGVQSATYLKAIETGVHIVDVAIAAMSGLTSQPNFNSIVNFMTNQPRENAIPLEKLNAYSAYFENVRDLYYPFESDLKSGTAEVYKNEIPGGQYSNLRSQARSMNLEDQFESIKENYAITNRMFGDIIKVTPSSKVVGDFALFLTTNGLTEKDVFAKGKELSFPESVKSFFKGDLGQPPGGFPPELQKIILKDTKPYTNLPNAYLHPVQLEEEFEFFKKKFEGGSYLDFLSYMLYPKVFEEYYDHYQKYGDVYKIPTENFFYGLQGEKQMTVSLSHGKEISISHLHTSTPDDQGFRTVSFRLNGSTRAVVIKDKKVKVSTPQNLKADLTNYRHIAAPLHGKLAEIFVKEGVTVALNQPLFTIEAMKMETTVTCHRPGRVSQIYLKKGILVQNDDLVMSVE